MLIINVLSIFATGETMTKLSVKARKWLLAAHVSFAALWTGTVLSIFLLSWRNTHSTNAQALYALNYAINILDDYVVIPSAIGSVLTATFLCWMTNYGFTKFYWVITKWILTTGLVVFGTFWLFPWANTAENISSEEGLQAFLNSIYSFDAQGVLIGSVIQVVFLICVISISVLKPWGRRPTTEQKQVIAD